MEAARRARLDQFYFFRGYKDAGNDDRLGSEDGEEGLLQYAIQQSLMEAGTHEDQVIE